MAVLVVGGGQLAEDATSDNMLMKQHLVLRDPLSRFFYLFTRSCLKTKVLFPLRARATLGITRVAMRACVCSSHYLPPPTPR